MVCKWLEVRQGWIQNGEGNLTTLSPDPLGCRRMQEPSEGAAPRCKLVDDVAAGHVEVAAARTLEATLRQV